MNIEARDKFTDTEALRGLINADVELVINDVSQTHGSGYGTWVTTVEINDKRYSLTHHNEDWYLSQKVLYNDAYCDSEEEHRENVEYHNMSVYRCIGANIDDIMSDNQ